MNDRMYELINQCFTGTPDGQFSPLNTVANVEKFAESIVRECMRMCDVAAIGYHTHGHIKEANGCASAKEYIADWFEVE